MKGGNSFCEPDEFGHVETRREIAHGEILALIAAHLVRPMKSQTMIYFNAVWVNPEWQDEGLLWVGENMRRSETQ
jgi:hypothetical protein